MSLQQIEFLTSTTNLAKTTRQLGGQTIIQPVIQSGTVSSAPVGSSGSVAVVLPVAYTTSAYNVQVTHYGDSSTAQMSITSQTSAGFTIFFSQAGGGVSVKSFYWNTFGL